MNVLLITNLFPTPTDPERGIFTLQLAKQLDSLCDLTVLCPLPWFPNTGLLRKFERWYQLAQVPEQYEIDGISVYSPKYFLLPRVSESIHASLMYRGMRKLVKRLHKEKHFDVINSQWLYPDSVAADKLASELCLPHVATGLGCDINDDLYHSEKAGKILSMLEKADGITVVSSRLKTELDKHGIEQDKIDVILNGVDLSRFKLLDQAGSRKKLKLDAGRQHLLYVGRLSEEKCVDKLIAAFARLQKNINHIRLLLVGDGPELSSLQEQVALLGISEDVKFIGKVSHEGLNDWFCAADIFCLPSKREGCPNVVLESLASGCPVVASDVGALPDLVNSETGMLFSPMDVEDMATKLARSLEKNWDRQQIRNSMHDLSWMAAAKRYLDSFSLATDKNKKAA